MTKRAKKIIMHGVTLLFIVASLAVAVFYFGDKIFSRYGQAFEDFVRSFCYYFVFLVTGRKDVIAQTIQIFPAEMETLLPLSFEEFKRLAELYVQLFFTKEVFLAWLDKTLQIIGDVAYYLSLFALPIVTWIIVMIVVYNSTDKDHNKDSGPLRCWKRFRDKFIKPCANAVKGYFRFLKSRKLYVLAFVLIWGYALNLLTIVVEAAAFVFYLGPAIRELNIWIQIAKLLIDFSVVWFFFPGIVWAAVGYILLDKWRRRLGRKREEEVLEDFEAFIERHPGALFITGKQRSKKTTLLTMFKLMYERIFRARAKKKLFYWKARFPFFPWINVEKFLTKARKDHKIYMLFHCRRFVQLLKDAYYSTGNVKWRKARTIRRLYGYRFKNLLFDFDVVEGKLAYDNALENVDIFHAIETYMQLFFIYSQRTPLDYSNYAIREDFTFKDYGNFPVFDGDLLKKTTKESYKATQYSYIIDYDAFRPGVKFDPSNPNKDAVEYGIRTMEEYAKERGNKDTRQRAAKGEEDVVATQNNDGYELDNKVRGQVALVDYDDYFVSLFDDQRAGSLGADNKDLATNGYIKGAAEKVFLLPFFEVETVLFALASKIYFSIYEALHSKKGSNTLLQYFLDKLFSPFFGWVERTQKAFTGWKVKLHMSDGGDEEDLGFEELIVLEIAAYRGRYASDSCKGFYEFRFARSKRGMQDFEQYQTQRVSAGQRQRQKSYFAELMLTQNGVQTSRKPKE